MADVIDPPPRNEPFGYPDGRDGSAWPKAFWALLFITTLIRLVYALKLPLTGDEAYLWDLARHPSLSYQDHPPMAAWILWLTTSVLGQSALAVRVAAVGTLSAVISLTYHLARRISGSEGFAFLASLLLMGIPLAEMGGVLFTTGTPLMGAGALGGYLFYLAVEENRSWAWWGLGVCFGIIFLTQIPAVVLPLAAYGYLIVSGEHRPFLKTPGPYIALFLSAAIFSPVLLWNSANQWATFKSGLFNLHGGKVPELKNTVDYILGQSLGLSPLVLIFTFPALAKGLLAGGESRMNPWKLTAFLALSSYGGFLAISPVTKVKIHWPAMGLPFLVLTITAFLVRRGNISGGYIAAGVTAWILTATVFLIPALPHVIPDNWEYPHRQGGDVASRMRRLTIPPRGAGEEVAGILAEMNSGSPTFVFTRSQTLSSLLAFYTPGNPQVTVLDEGDTQDGDHSRWFSPEDHAGENALFLSQRSLTGQRAFLLERFERIEPVTDAHAEVNGYPLTVVRCYGYRGQEGE